MANSTTSLTTPGIRAINVNNSYYGYMMAHVLVRAALVHFYVFLCMYLIVFQKALRCKCWGVDKCGIKTDLVAIKYSMVQLESRTHLQRVFQYFLCD